MIQNKNNKKRNPPLATVRINKYLADKGLATRREADRLIEKGIVLVNGKPASLGTRIKPGDRVTMKGDVTPTSYRYFAYNKKVGVTTTKEVNTPDILSVTKFPEKVFPVGRLDKDSSGLIIMTNDGRVTERLLHPRFFHEKEYHVALNHDVTNTLLRGWKTGTRLGEIRIRPVKVRKTGPRDFDVILTEGHNRQIRRMAKAFGYEVVALTRFRVENILLGTLKEGTFREFSETEKKEFLKRLKL